MSENEVFVPLPCPFCGSIQDHADKHEKTCYLRLLLEYRDKFCKPNFSFVGTTGIGLKDAIDAAQIELSFSWNKRPIEEKLNREIVELIEGKL